MHRKTYKAYGKNLKRDISLLLNMTSLEIFRLSLNDKNSKKDSSPCSLKAHNDKSFFAQTRNDKWGSCDLFATV